MLLLQVATTIWSATCGTIAQDGWYTAPANPTGPCIITATRASNGQTKQSSATVRFAGADVGWGVGLGAWSYPPDSLGTGPYDVTVISGGNINPGLAQARARHGRVAIMLGRSQSIANGELSVQAATREVKSWPDLSSSLNAEIIAVIIGDDVEAPGVWGITPWQNSLPLFDQIACAVKARWPTAVTAIRALPIQLTSYDWTRTTCLDLAWAQYHKSRGPLVPWRDQQLATARNLGLGIIFGLNVLDGGDGSSGVPGTYKPGEHPNSQMSAAEVQTYGTALLPYSCVLMDWQYSPAWNYPGRPAAQTQAIRNFDRRADVRAALDSLSRLAGSLPARSC